jgi:exodeoxyribonuclease VII large subunit
VIVVGRGGGSLEDLWAFNEEAVARAIAACRTPCVSAVGHEIDVTIADLVADLRAATPSQAGELVVPVLDDLLRDLEHRRARASQLVRTRLDRAWQRVEATRTRPCVREPLARLAALRRHLDHVAARLEARSPRAELARRRQAVEDLASRAGRGLRARFDALAARLAEVRARLDPRALAAELENRRQAVDGLGGRAHRGARGALEGALRRYESRRAQVEALSPLRVLDRGYSLTRVAKDGEPLLKSVAQAAPGDRLRTQLSDGFVESRVESVRPAERA